MVWFGNPKLWLGQGLRGIPASSRGDEGRYNPAGAGHASGVDRAPWLPGEMGKPENMSQVKVSIRDHGPLLVSGPIEVLDGEGKALTLPAEKPMVALCRCGASANKPFCDGAHKSAGFQSTVRCPS